MYVCANDWFSTVKIKISTIICEKQQAITLLDNSINENVYIFAHKRKHPRSCCIQLWYTYIHVLMSPCKYDSHMCCIKIISSLAGSGLIDDRWRQKFYCSHMKCLHLKCVQISSAYIRHCVLRYSPKCTHCFFSWYFVIVIYHMLWDHKVYSPISFSVTSLTLGQPRDWLKKIIKRRLYYFLDVLGIIVS